MCLPNCISSHVERLEFLYPLKTDVETEGSDCNRTSSLIIVVVVAVVLVVVVVVLVVVLVVVVVVVVVVVTAAVAVIMKVLDSNQEANSQPAI